MEFSPDILQYVYCPHCEGKLYYTKEKVLFCVGCRLCYSVKEGIPDLTVEAALPLSRDGKMASTYPIAHFLIESGPDNGKAFRVEKGTCLALGRSLEDQNTTRIMSFNGNLVFDDHTKQLIQNYLNRNSPQKKELWQDDAASIGSFKRLKDIVLKDEKVSRLHAMIFYDAKGPGILDLVSRNGTFVDNKEVEAHLLKEGCSIQIGQNMIRFSYLCNP